MYTHPHTGFFLPTNFHFIWEHEGIFLRNFLPLVRAFAYFLSSTAHFQCNLHENVSSPSLTFLVLLARFFFIDSNDFLYFTIFSPSSEQPIFTCQAHVFHIDPKTKRTWITASSKAISVSFFYDSSRNLYRIISVEGSKVIWIFLHQIMNLTPFHHPI